MKRLVVVCLLSLGACSSGEQVYFADGSRTQLEHWDDRWLVINYWAEWCAPCREEIPELNELHHERVQHGLVVLGVNWDGVTGEKLASVIDRMQIEFPTLKDDPHLKYGFDKAQQLPATVLISPEREVAAVLMGPQTQASILARTKR